jgi:tRNA modification enzyme MnmG/GidA-like protein
VSALVSVRFGIPCALVRHGAMRPIANLLCLQVKVSGLSREMNEKLTGVPPRTLGQASRIPGVTPAAVSLINVYIEIQSRRQTPARST